MIEQQSSNLSILCDIVRPFLMNDPALLKAFRKQLKHWAREEADENKYLCEADVGLAIDLQRYAIEIVTGTTLMKIGFPSDLPF